MVKEMIDVKSLSFWLIGFFMIFSVPLGHSFAMQLQASIIWPAIGLGFALFFIYQQKAFIPVWLGLFIGYILGLSFVIGYDIPLALTQAFLQSSGAFLVILLGYLIANRLEIKGLLKPRNISLFFIIAIMMSALASLVGQAFLILQSLISIDEFAESFLVWFLGDLFSFLVVSCSIIITFQYDKKRSLRADIVRKEAVFYLFFILFSAAIFSDLSPLINYDHHKFFYLPFAFYLALYLPYRSFVVTGTIFLSMFVVSPPYSLEDVSYFYLMMDINLFMVLILLSIFMMKAIFHSLDEERRRLNVTSRRLSRLIASIEGLMRLSSDIKNLDYDRHDLHASNVFRIIFNMFNVFDYGSCMMMKEGNIVFLDTVGHDKDYLNAIEKDVEDWVTEMHEPRIFKFDKKEFVKGFKKQNLNLDKVKFFKESLRMSLKLKEDFVIFMSFDVRMYSPRRLDDRILDYFKSIHVLLSSFYEAEILTLEEEQTKNNIINSLLSIIALYDKATHRHSKAVGDIALNLAKRMNLSTEHQQNLYWAGIIHDIGKVGIDEDLVNKPGVYTVAEYEAMKKHVQLGADLIAQSENLKMIAALVQDHHERFDGEGYPAKKNGSEMMIDTHILIISEAIGTMIFDWPYQKRKNDEAIMAELKKESKKQFHPLVVERAIEMIKSDGLDIFKS